MNKKKYRLLIMIFCATLIICCGLPYALTAFSMDDPASGGDISSIGLNLDENTPTVNTIYTAGSGTILWEPELNGENAIIGGTLTMDNAFLEINSEAPIIRLPKTNVTVKLEGTSTMTNSCVSADPLVHFIPIISQGALIDNSGSPGVVTAKDYALNVTGSGTLLVSAPQGDSISTDGTFIMKSGTIKGFQDSNSNGTGCSVTTADFKMEGGTLITYGMLMINGNADVTGGSIVTPGRNDSVAVVVGDFNISGGSVKFGTTNSNFGMEILGHVNQTGGTLDALILSSQSATSAICNVYGNVTLEKYSYDGNFDEISHMSIGVLSGYTYGVTIPQNSTLTIPQNSTMEISIPAGGELSQYVIKDGTLVNNGIIRLPDTATDDEVMAVVSGLTPAGTGCIKVGSKVYSNSGIQMNIISQPLDLTGYGDLTGIIVSFPGGTYTGNSTDGYVLTLDYLYLMYDLILPSNVPVTISTKSVSTICGNIRFGGDYACNLTFEGNAALSISGGIHGNATNNDTVTVTNGAQLTLNDGINIGASGGSDGTLVVSGAGTKLSVSSEYTAIYCDTVNVLDGGALYASSSEGNAIFAHSGGVTVTNGSLLSVKGNYGLYILDGMLNVDKTSTLSTNASIAPFCIVDEISTGTSEKTQSEIISLPSSPAGTSVVSVKGEDKGYEICRYWSLVSTDTLQVSNEYSEPVSLLGAATGPLTFVQMPHPELNFLSLKDLYTFGDTIDASVSGSLPNEVVTYEFKGTGTTTYNSIIVPTDCGTFKVTATAPGNDMYAGTSVTKSFEIQLASMKDLVVNDVTKIYNGEPYSITVTGAPIDSTIEYKVVGGDYSSTNPTFTDVGTYTVYYKVTNKNYTTVEKPASVIIGNADMASLVSAKDITGTYNGNAYSITVTGTPSESTIEYKVDGGTYSSINPTFIDAGTYTVYYKVTKKNYTTVEKSAIVTIGNADMASLISAGNVTKTYNGEPYSITVTGAPTGSTIEYKVDGGTYTSTNPTFTDAGTYTVYYKVTNKNYTTVEKTAIVKINNADMTDLISASNVTKTYNGESYSITVTGAPTDSTIEYKVDGGTYSSTNPTFTDVGTYTVYYKVINKNYTTVEKSAIVTIGNADMASLVSAEDVTKIYNGKAYSITVTGAPTDSTIEYKVEGGTYSSTNPSFTDVGIYTVYYKVANKNYTTVEKSAIVKINNTDMTDLISAGNVTKTYNGEPYSITVTGAPTDSTIEYKVDGGTYTSTNPTFTDAGTYTVYYKVTKKNYKCFENHATVKILNATLTGIEVNNVTKTYDGNSYTIDVHSIPNGSNITYSLVNGTDYTANDISFKNVGVYTVYYRITKKNYSIMDGSAIITINKKSITDFNLLISKDSYQYTGKRIEPEVKIGELKEGVDYTVEYTDNIEVGKAKITVTGINMYTGTLSRNFNITAVPGGKNNEEMSTSSGEGKTIVDSDRNIDNDNIISSPNTGNSGYMIIIFGILFLLSAICVVLLRWKVNIVNKRQ